MNVLRIIPKPMIKPDLPSVRNAKIKLKKNKQKPKIPKVETKPNKRSEVNSLNESFDSAKT